MIIVKDRLLNTLVEAFIYQRTVQTANVYWQMKEFGITPGVEPDPESKIVRLKPNIEVFR